VFSSFACRRNQPAARAAGFFSGVYPFLPDFAMRRSMHKKDIVFKGFTSNHQIR
jgi:hypothetical protein